MQLPNGTLVDGKARFDSALDLPFHEACDFLDISGDRWQIEVSGEDATTLVELAEQRQAARRAA